MADPFESFRAGLESPASRHYPVTLASPGPTVLDPKPRALYAASDGNIEIIDDLDEAVVYAVTAGDVITFRAAALGGDTTADVVVWY